MCGEGVGGGSDAEVPWDFEELLREMRSRLVAGRCGAL